MRLGVLANLSAGGGRGAAICEAFNQQLKEHSLYAVKGFGGEMLASAVCLTLPTEEYTYVEKISAAVKALVNNSPDALLILGGDGFAAYIADALIQSGNNTLPLIGVAGGTANVGPIISMNSLPASLSSLCFEALGAIEVSDEEGHIAYGFNDVVLGNTFLTTIDGNTCTASATALWKDGRIVPQTPLKDIGQVQLRMRGSSFQSSLPCVSQIIASPMDGKSYYGKAVSGLLCYTPSSPYKTAVVLTQRPLVSCDDDHRGFSSPAPLEQLLVATDDILSIHKLNDGVSVIIDGNPYPRHGAVHLCYKPSLIYAARKGDQLA